MVLNTEASPGDGGRNIPLSGIFTVPVDEPWRLTPLQGDEAMSVDISLYYVVEISQAVLGCPGEGCELGDQKQEFESFLATSFRVNTFLFICFSQA